MTGSAFRIPPPANCQFANLAWLLHSADISPVPVLGGLIGFCLDEAPTVHQLLSGFLDAHLRTVWGVGVPWLTVEVRPEMSARDLADEIVKTEPRQRDGVLVGISMPITRVTYREDMERDEGTYHYLLRCVHGPQAVTTVDATPTPEVPEPIVLDRTDTLDSLVGGGPFPLLVNRPWDVIEAMRLRGGAPDGLVGHAAAAVRSELVRRAEGRSSTLEWVARRWAESADAPDEYFSPHCNIFKFLTGQRMFLPELLRAATRGSDAVLAVNAGLNELQRQYRDLGALSLKLHVTRAREHRLRVIAAGTQALERLLEAERTWALSALDVLH